ncbi:lysozyme inhibitor LprI family protein [Paracoccus aminophilus]|uniref:Lysozyme inhibitor LprI-like N-terminal domain-containing protein n=1 Tax=Paracoccus aminophilus JCM 7686 TaxID=1367847 RepID=S5YDA0_PARAH|nr:lysozyme inhibitor LprI family protein [Paracoccus aminophilus]AGT09433.1 hypothetical protein JCM7686_2363 [Paracoccus aminophilus JCM 7686]
MLKALLIAGFAIATPAFAIPAFAEGPDMPDYNPEILSSCLDHNKGYDDRAACIGQASDKCMSDAKGQTTVGMVQCLGLERSSWDGLLNDTYKSLQDEQRKADDAQKADDPASTPARVAKLQQMEKNWIAFRDSACAFDATQWEGGSQQGPSVESCMLQLTARQTLLLETYLADERQEN